MEKQMDTYFDLQEMIFVYFGYIEDWKVIPLVDHRDDYWLLDQNDDGSGEITYYENRLTEQILKDGDCYSAVIYTQRFLRKWVYRGEEYTLVCMDTQCDDNKWLGIFSNSKEQKSIRCDDF